MKSHWMSAMLVGSALIVGCGDRGTQTLQETAPPDAVENEGVAEIAPPVDPASAPATSKQKDDSAVDRTPAPTSSSAPVAPSAPPAPRWREVTVPAGTALPLALLSAISSETAQVETPVRARLRQAVVVDGYTALPAGTVLNGSVIEVERAGRVQGRSRLAFRFTEAEFDGGREDVRTNPITFEGEQTKGEDATKIGVGAGAGAIIGGLLGGGDGAAKGAAIGGAAGTGVVLATRGREVTLAAGTDLAATLATPFEARVSAK